MGSHGVHWSSCLFKNYLLLIKNDIIQGGAKRTHVFESACDFFLWGYLKSKVYVRKPRRVDDLKVSVREEIATVPQEMLVNVMQNFEERLRTCVQARRTPSFRYNFP